MERSTVTIREVARAANVSTATVSRVLNNDPRVRYETRKIVLEAMEATGYTFNAVARSLKTSRTATVGIIAPDLSGDFFMFIAESMNRELTLRGYSLLVATSLGSEKEEARQIQLLAERLVDGIVLIPVGKTGEHIAQLSGSRLPIVLVDRTAPGFETDAVLATNEQGAYEAVTALIRDGQARIGFLGGDLDVLTARERYEGYKRAMLEAGLKIEPNYIFFGNPTLPYGYRTMEKIAKDPNSPDAWFLVNLFVHIGATNYLALEGKERAARMVFAAFDEMPFSPLLRFCRYAVQQPISELGKAAAKLIISRIEGNGPAEPQILRFKTRLIQHLQHRQLNIEKDIGKIGGNYEQ